MKNKKMGSHQVVGKFISKYIRKRTVAFQIVFVEVFGGINEALLLQQLLFWNDKGSRKDGYIYKTMDEIQEEIMISHSQQRRAREVLEKIGVLKTKIARTRGETMRHYKVNVQELIKVISEYHKIPPPSIQEITQEKTTTFSSNKEKDNSSNKEGGSTKTVKRIIKYFIKKCSDQIGVEPIVNTAGKNVVRYALNTGRLTEEQIQDLLEDWFASGVSDEDAVQITMALSTNQINRFKARHCIA